MLSTSNMPLVTYLFSLLYLVNLTVAGYVLKDDYNPSAFFDMFDFFTWSDPTHGFVQYVDQATASANGYIDTSSNRVFIGTDHTNVTPGGRPSVRLTSKNSYNSGSLVILDLAHMPVGCGTWPAFWMVGPNWPNGGEIDIIEGVNLQTTNAMTLHSSDGCSITDNGNFTGYINTDDCYINAEGQPSNAGCSIDTTNTNTYGTGFNNNGGGVYAMEWTDAAITIWFFPRGSIPSDITNQAPNPSGWGEPLSQFQGCCDIPEYFVDNQIVFDLTYCGDWAGNVWSSSSCASMASTCNSYVENNPSAFANAYWVINSLQVYQSSSYANVKIAAVAPVSSTTSTSTSAYSAPTPSSAYSASTPSSAYSASTPTSIYSASTSAEATSALLQTSAVTSSTSAAVSTSYAEPTTLYIQTSSTANTVSVAQAVASAWSTSEPETWSSAFQETEDDLQAATSQAAEAAAKLAAVQNSKRSRHLAGHRRRVHG